MTKPPALRKGDTVGIIAPSGVVDPSELTEGIRQIEALGFRTAAGRHVLKSHRYMAGTDEERAADLHEVMSDPSVKAVMCARGGFGATRLLPRLDRSLLSARPKILIGSSDVTALLSYWVAGLNQVSFHGPMVTPNFGRGTSSLTNEGILRVLGEVHPPEPVRFGGLQSLRTGVAEGTLIGGCLSILCALLGTPYAPDTRDAVLFLEDVNEPPYRVDRMMTHLKLAGKLAGIRGIVFGKMVDCDPKPSDGYTLQEVLKEALADIPGPLLYGLAAGHGGEQVTLPLGTRVRIDGDRGELVLLEGGVSD